MQPSTTPVDMLWLSWEDALASHDTRGYASNVLRATVMARTPHRDGWPDLGMAPFDTAALKSLTGPADRLDQIAESLQLFTAMNRLPAHQLDVIVLRRQTPEPPTTPETTAPQDSYLPAPPPDLDCSDLDGPVPVGPGDPHRLDRDGDGIGCESN